MVKENAILYADVLNLLKEDITRYEELLKDLVSVFSSMLNHGVHSYNSMLNIVQRISANSSRKQSSEMNSTDAFDGSIQETIPVQYANKRKYNEKDDDDMDIIRFTGNGPIFSLSKKVIEAIPYSYIYEQSAKELRTTDGAIFLDYPGNDSFIYYFLDYLNGMNINFNQLRLDEQMEFLELLEFCSLPIPLELVYCRDKRDNMMKKYVDGDNVDLILNGKTNVEVKNYFVRNRLWDSFLKNYCNGYVDYNKSENKLYIIKNYEYIEYISTYIRFGCIYLSEEEIETINMQKLENELYSLFGNKGKNSIIKCTDMDTSFYHSQIVNKKTEIPLVNWLGKEKKWKLLFRASEHNYSADEFHFYCDNKGETVTLIKNISKNNHMNIFGGYTDQDWDCSYKFLFTLSNGYNIPPTKYNYTNKYYGNAICCEYSYGPTFSYDISICDQCHSIKESSCFKSSYNEPAVNKRSLFVDYCDEHDNTFIVEDYEVWGRA
ncbi:hypothetical protein WA158_006117 [Blastocystis sp. Blastoise]